MQNESKPNYFVRVLISILCLLIAGMIIFKFIFVNPPGEINSGLIILISFLIILVLSESFDNFSLGKLLSITREKKKAEVEVEKLEKRNSELISQLITTTNHQTQTQMHTNVYGDYHAAQAVTKASTEEVEENKSSEVTAPLTTEEQAQPRTSYNWRTAEKIALDNYLQNKKIHASNFITEVKLTTQFHGIDPVSNFQPIYDAYYRQDTSEVFVEFRPNRGMPMMYRDRLYVMLSKISYYKTTKNVDAYLELIIMNIPDEDPSRFGGIGRVLESFEPAIASGLLRISEITFTDDQLNQIRESE